ncbi:hypothetical protein PUNSTDRAFT_42403 [Punctularia strigosozonata HHB-11173 SS5]|uniref:uncharacterized protein n=1 Tax=Punctularia strigosozonata (strain HHB-11173) TaxID=741275 RepID=UPI000441789C|nr:uncharacterized protein PUNSTDRAFT_42403 [Punctularia strigosozonata HHB-11173 SS5]EIN12959.1 hypothetical protein PUNSTDRAFT_42403 [Punctularia strigosozonata HHB-11173 SS5]
MTGSCACGPCLSAYLFLLRLTSHDPEVYMFRSGSGIVGGLASANISMMIKEGVVHAGDWMKYLVVFIGGQEAGIHWKNLTIGSEPWRAVYGNGDGPVLAMHKHVIPERRARGTRSRLSCAT